DRRLSPGRRRRAAVLDSERLRTRALPYVFLAAPVLFWGGSFRTTAIAAQHTPALLVGALRTGPAAIMLLALLPVLGARLPRGRDLAWAAATGVLMVTVFLSTMAEATALAG